MKLPLFNILLLSAFQAAALADPALIKAKVDEPVLQELMGGCSLKCAFAWSVEVQPLLEADSLAAGELRVHPALIA